jgi:hypothetical protein
MHHYDISTNQRGNSVVLIDNYLNNIKLIELFSLSKLCTDSFSSSSSLHSCALLLRTRTGVQGGRVGDWIDIRQLTVS